MITLIFLKKTRIYLLLVLMLSGGLALNAQSNKEIKQWKKDAKGAEVGSVEASLKLTRVYWNLSIDSSVIYSRQAKTTAITLKNDSLISMSEILLAISFYYMDQLDSTLHYCNSALKRSKNNKVIRAKVLDLFGEAYRRLGNFDTSLYFCTSSLAMYRQLGLENDHAKVLGHISSTYYEMGNYSKSIQYSLEAAKIFESQNDSLNLARRYGTIANLYADLKNNDKSMKYFKQGLALVIEEKAPMLYYKFLFNIATIFHNLHRYDSALALYDSSLRHYVEVNDLEGIAIAHQDIGLSYAEMHEYDKAISHLLEGYRRFKKLSTVKNIAYVLSDLGMTYNRAGKVDSAIYYLNESVEVAKKYQLVREERRAEDYLYQVYKGTGDYKLALNNYEKYRDINDSINGQQMKEKIADLNMKYEADKKDHRIEQLILNDKVNAARIKMFVLVGSLLFIIGILLVTILYYKKHIQTRLLLVKGKLLEKEKYELDKELTFKQKQLTSHALHMTQKNEILQNIRKAVNEVMPDIPDKTRDKVRKLQQELNKSLRYDKDWELFSMYFNELNKDFFDKLTSINPKLSQYDLRLSALLRMNMNIKEAAAVLNIEPDSVKTARYKLRKKLGLQPNDDLVKFILRL